MPAPWWGSLLSFCPLFTQAGAGRCSIRLTPRLSPGKSRRAELISLPLAPQAHPSEGESVCQLLKVISARSALPCLRSSYLLRLAREPCRERGLFGMAGEAAGRAQHSAQRTPGGSGGLTVTSWRPLAGRHLLELGLYTTERAISTAPATWPFHCQKAKGRAGRDAQRTA